MATSFIKQTNPGTALVVDGINLAFRWKHQGKTDFADEYISTVRSLASSYSAKDIIIAADQGSSSYRKAIFPEYKQNRKDKIKDQTEEEQQAFIEFVEEYERTLELIQYEFGWPVIRFQGVEADDIAAYIVKERFNFGIEHIWLVSSDKDWDLLVADDVSRFSYVTRKEVTPEKWAETHKDGYTMEQYLSIKCLQGDKKDNVPGINQVGPKRAMALLDQYGTAMDIYDSCPLEGKYAYIKNLNEGYEQILTNYTLLDLLSFCEDAIGPENLKLLDKAMLER